MENQKFGRSQRLKSRKLINHVFQVGKRIFSTPLVAVLTSVQDDIPTSKAGFTVSKRNFKKAVTRNLLKRQMREIYRTSQRFYKTETRFNIMFIYSDKTIVSFKEIETAMHKILSELKKQHS